MGGEEKCAVAAYLPEERGAQDSTFYLVGVAEQLTVAFHLGMYWIGAPTQEAPLPPLPPLCVKLN